MHLHRLFHPSRPGLLFLPYRPYRDRLCRPCPLSLLFRPSRLFRRERLAAPEDLEPQLVPACPAPLECLERPEGLQDLVALDRPSVPGLSRMRQATVMFLSAGL